MGKTEKEKAKDKEKGKVKDSKRDKVPKILKAGAGAGKAKRKKWSKSKSKEKLNNTVFWTKPIWDKLQKDVIAKESYLTPSVVSEKLKVNVSLAREAIKALRDEQKIAPFNEYHSKYCCFVKTANFTAPVAEKKEQPTTQQKGEKKQQQQKAK